MVGYWQHGLPEVNGCQPRRNPAMAKAMERHTMIATGMNGETLTPVHGAPMRSLVPGWVGSASIKWATAIEGRAWVGESSIRRVDLSFDEGVTWQRASLDRRGDRFAWRQFSLDYMPEKSGYQTVLARATDDRGNVQPFLPAWHPLGYYWNGVHRVGFTVEA